MEAKRIAADHAMAAGGIGSHAVFASGGRSSSGIGRTRIPSASSYTCHGKLAARGMKKIQYGDVRALTSRGTW